MKVNTDGARKDDYSAGYGGVIRDERGVWISGFSKNLGSCNVILAEIWGMYEGLKITKSLGLRRVDVNVDSLVNSI